MNGKQVGLILAFSVLTGEAFANKPVVAVFEIQNKAQISQAEVEELTDFVAAQLTASGKYRVVPNSELQSALRQKKSESYEACYDESCQIEIGKEIAAEKTLATKVSRLGENCVVTMQLYDLRQGASGKGATRRGSCGINSILKLIESASQDLTDVTAKNNSIAVVGTQNKLSSSTDSRQNEEAREIAINQSNGDWTKDIRQSAEVNYSTDTDLDLSVPLLTGGVGAVAAIVGIILGASAVADYQSGSTGADTHSSAVAADALIWTGGLTTIGGLVWYFLE